MALLSSGILKSFLRGLQIMDVYGTLPIKWNWKSQRVVLKSPRKISVNRKLLALAFFIVGTASFQLGYTWNDAPTPLRTFCMMSTSIAVMGLGSTYASYKDPYLLTGLLNGIISYEECYKGKSKPEKGNPSTERFQTFLKISISLISWTVHFLLFASFVNIFKNPCFPTYAGFWLVSDCRGHLGIPPQTMGDELGWKIFIAGVVLLSWVVFFPGLHFQCCLMIVQGYGFISCIRHNKREILTSTFSPRSTQSLAIPFRKIQLMTILNRLITATYVCQAIMICGIFCQIGALYNCIDVTRGAKIPMQMIVACASFAFVSVLVFMLCFGLLGSVYKVSLESQQRIKTGTAVMRNRWFRRFHQSCPTLKVHFGSQNYFDPMTPLNLEQFVISQTISLLLVK